MKKLAFVQEFMQDAGCKLRVFPEVGSQYEDVIGVIDENHSSTAFTMRLIKEGIKKVKDGSWTADNLLVLCEVLEHSKTGYYGNMPILYWPAFSSKDNVFQ